MEYKSITLPDGLRDLTVEFIQGVIDTFDIEDKLHKLDTISLYLLADNINTYLECEENIKIYGLVQTSDRGNTSLSPYVILQKQVQNSIFSLLREFGLTLGSRTKMKEIKTEEMSPLMGFLGKK